jgi:hypothetical protein
MAKRGAAARWWIVGFLGVAVAAGGVAWMQRTALLAWWYVGGLTAAADADRALWVERVAGLDQAALSGLLDLLRREDAHACANARAALDCLVQRWTMIDPRSVDLLERLSRDYPRFSAAGRRTALAQVAAWRRQPPGGKCDAGAGLSLLAAVLPCADAEVQLSALDLSAVVLEQKPSPAALGPTRALLRACLQAADVRVRLRAVRAAQRPDLELMEPIVALLNDREAEVRRAAIAAVGPADQTVLDETLLPCLRDPDPEVRRLCEAALRVRGLTDDHLRLSRLLVDPQPAVRLQVLDYLGASADLEPGVWLRRLSHDPAPSVRAAAARVMGQQRFVDLSDRLDQMARSDPSPTVSYLADYYLKSATKPIR